MSEGIAVPKGPGRPAGSVVYYEAHDRAALHEALSELLSGLVQDVGVSTHRPSDYYRWVADGGVAACNRATSQLFVMHPMMNNMVAGTDPLLDDENTMPADATAVRLVTINCKGRREKMKVVEILREQGYMGG